MIPYIYLPQFHLGPLTIYTWGFVVSIGLAVAIFVAYRRYKSLALSDATKLSFDCRVILDLAFWILVAAFIGARLFHVFLYEWPYYRVHLNEIIRIDQGGLSSFGGLIGAAVAFWFYFKYVILRRAKRGEGSRANARNADPASAGRDSSPSAQNDNLILRYTDLLMFAWPLGHGIGRLGCFLVHMHPGRLSNVPWAVQYPGGPRLDMGLIESVVLLSYWVIIALVSKKRVSSPSDGSYVVMGILFYGATRFVLDFFRATDLPMSDTRYFGLTPAQYGSVALVLVGIYLWKMSAKQMATD